MQPDRPLRIGVLFVGDARDPRARSGTPYGVVTGLERLGVEVTTVRATPPSLVEKGVGLAVGSTLVHRASGASLQERARTAYGAAHVAPTMARIRSMTGQRAVRRASVDGWVQLGAGYQVDVAEPRVVYDDMTVAQATEFPYTNWAAQRPSAIRYRIALQRAVYQSATACCMTSSWAAGSALTDYAVPSDRVHVVGAGTHQPARSVDRDWSTPRFLFIGFDWRRKNGDRLLAAFARVREAHPSAELALVGGHPDVDQPGVTGYGVLRRDVPADAELLRGLFDAATCFVMPSLFEPAGVVFTEAAAAGLPSIGGTVGGSRDFIGDGGLVVEPTSTQELADAMLRLSDPAEAQATGARAASRSPLFTWDAVATRLVSGLSLAERAGLLPSDHLQLHVRRSIKANPHHPAGGTGVGVHHLGETPA